MIKNKYTLQNYWWGGSTRIMIAKDLIYFILETSLSCEIIVTGLYSAT